MLADTGSNGVSELFSLFVLPDERNRGIGSQMLEIMEKHLKSNKFRFMQVRLRDEWKNFETVKKMIERRGWELPYVARIIAEADIHDYLKVPWPDHYLPSNLSLINRKDLPDEYEEQLKHIMEVSRIPVEFNPLQHHEHVFLPASYFLTKDSRLIGWNLAYHIAPNCVEYNNLFLFPDNRERGYGIALIRKSFEEQLRLEIPLARWVINTDNGEMMKIYNRLGRKYVKKHIQVFISRKILN